MIRYLNQLQEISLIMNKLAGVLALFLLISCTSENPEYRSRLDLSGEWQFALDADNAGVSEEWFAGNLSDTVLLPGTTDSNQKGFLNSDTTTLHLNRVFKYEGPAWYRKTVHIPSDFEGKHIQLVLERTKTTNLWIDGEHIGESRILQSPQRYDVSEFLTPGEHSITMMIDNSLHLTPYRETHIFSDETQTNWNGVIGEMYLEIMPKTYISNLQVHPDVANRKAIVHLEMENGLNLDRVSIELMARRNLDGKTKKLTPLLVDTTAMKFMGLEYFLGDESLPWDEYEQPLYELTAVLKGDGITDSKTVPFGMRNFAVNGTQFTINGRNTFLRGKNDAAVFPLTGYTPADVESWLRIFEIAKSWGINHYRFHSYTPPKAAFIAADQTGIYLQPELPFWGGLDSTNVAAMLREEGFALLKEFANHPSFVMFSHGNEIWSGHDNVEANLKALKEYDPRPLYAMGSNNSIGYVFSPEVADFHVAARTPSAGDTTLTHTRITHAFADSRNGGILNTTTPSTDFDFSYPVSQIDIPLITHEIGQYQVYPNYAEIDKYTGPVRAWNLEVFEHRLADKGMADMDEAFQKASGAWSALCYKAEMEAAVRTPGLAGFQLLDLQDFSGQGTALIGMLDAFMDDKKVVSREIWKQSCNDVMLLLDIPKFVWTSSDIFTAGIEVANYSNRPLDSGLHWQLVNVNGQVIDKGTSEQHTFTNGGLTSAGNISSNLASIRKPEKLALELSLEGTSYTNSYPVWVYPEIATPEIPDDILVSESFDSHAIAALENGGKVLLFPKREDVKANSVGGLFPPDFWNYEMFKGISENNGKSYSPGTLGLLMDPEHPIFNSFPTDFHTNWQWFSVIKASHPLILDSTPKKYRPVVQVIDNLQRNHKLGLVFEFKIGEGKLLVCMAELPKISDHPEAAHLYQSILNYMHSRAFEPLHTIDLQELTTLLR